MTNDPRAAGIVGVVLSMFLLFGLTYLAFGERLGIKSPGPNAKPQSETLNAPIVR